MVAAKFVSSLLGLLLGVIFTAAGVVKLTDQVDENAYLDMTSKFEQYHEALQVATHFPGRSAEEFRILIGFVEVACGAILMFPPLSFLVNLVVVPLGFVVNYVLLAVMVGALYTLVRIGDDVTPPVMLGTFLVVYTLASVMSLAKAPLPVADEQKSRTV